MRKARNPVPGTQERFQDASDFHPARVQRADLEGTPHRLFLIPTRLSRFLLPRQSLGNMSCSPVGRRAVGEKTNVLWEGWLQGHTGVSNN